MTFYLVHAAVVLWVTVTAARVLVMAGRVVVIAGRVLVRAGKVTVTVGVGREPTLIDTGCKVGTLTEALTETEAGFRVGTPGDGRLMAGTLTVGRLTAGRLTVGNPSPTFKV